MVTPSRPGPVPPGPIAPGGALSPSARPGAASAYAPTPGPVDRVTFFEEQRRNRRQSWRFAVLGAIAVVVTGIPVSIIVTPYLYAFVLLVGHVTNAIRPLPPATMQRLHDVAYLFPHAVGRIVSTKSVAGLPATLPAMLVLVVPGALVTIWLWLVVRLVFRSTGVGGTLLRLGARPPRPNDIEEHQLVNLVEEMAIAAGVQPPRLMLIDTRVANAAAVGTSQRDDVIVVTRGLLDTLDRRQTQAVIGHLIGSVGNGDLRIANHLLSVYRAFGLVDIVLDSALAPAARRVVWRLMRLAVLRRGSDDEVQEAGALTDLLERVTAGSADAELAPPARRSSGFVALVRGMCIEIPAVTAQLAIGMASGYIFGPAFAALWRARRRLADASAVQLTRDPDALASALERLAQADVTVTGGDGVSFLFTTWRGSGGPSLFSSFQPSTTKRLKRLAAQGAKLRAARVAPARGRWALGVLWLLLAPLFAIAIAASLLAFAVMMVINVAFMSIALVAADVGLGAIFKYGPVVIHKYIPLLVHKYIPLIVRRIRAA
ncbi:MAG: M48 family metalloprotease [Gemmatimonadaceae bacterium]|nr:M48 family metalloprotease [Gemmatimonadaceae bacterium]